MRVFARMMDWLASKGGQGKVVGPPPAVSHDGKPQTTTTPVRWPSSDGLPTAEWLIADRGYDTDWIVGVLKDEGICP